MVFKWPQKKPQMMWILTKMPKRSIQRCVTRFWRAKNQRSLGWHWQTIDLHKNIHILVMEHADSSTKYSFPTKNDWNELKRKEEVLRYLSELGSILIGTSYPTWIYQQMILIWANLSTCSMFTSIHWERCNSSTHLKSIKLFSWVGKKLPHRLSLSRRIMGSQNWWFGDPDKPSVFFQVNRSLVFRWVPADYLILRVMIKHQQSENRLERWFKIHRVTSVIHPAQEVWFATCFFRRVVTQKGSEK